jgi:hypothetical protein
MYRQLCREYFYVLHIRVAYNDNKNTLAFYGTLQFTNTFVYLPLGKLVLSQKAFPGTSREHECTLSRLSLSPSLSLSSFPFYR